MGHGQLITHVSKLDVTKVGYFPEEPIFSSRRQLAAAERPAALQLLDDKLR